ncbi:MAG TPA: CorA family divalent cation transporter [Caulobacteraceae bacterium]
MDLIAPDETELAAVEAAFGVRVPTRAEVSEIEVSSRLKVEHGALYMSAPLVAGTQGDAWETAPTGFVLCPKVCITVRFEKVAAFDAVDAALQENPNLTPDLALIRLLEEVVDRAADHLEVTAEDLTQASRAIFQDPVRRSSKRAMRSDLLRQTMTRVGRASDHMSHARYTLVCIGRMAQFVVDRAHDWIEPEALDRLNAVHADILSLEQFEENLLSRVQLLQDAATAFISIEQNDVVKVLTIASVVGVPPVLVVGVYGMNFRLMPELTWALGYPYALVLMVASAVVPLIWFKAKGWM